MRRTRPFARSLAVGAIYAVIGGLISVPALANGQSLLHPVKDGGVARLVSESKGNVVLVNFWATWCSPCREELPHLLKLEQSLSKQGLRLIVISADEPEAATEANQFLDSIGAPKPRYIKETRDNDAFINAIDPKWSGALPALFLYDRTGKRVASFFGETEIEVITTAVRKAVEEASPPKQTSESVGS